MNSIRAQLRQSRGVCMALPLALVVSQVLAAPVAGDSRMPIYIHRAGTGNLEGLKNGILLTVDACRTAKQLPVGPVKLPSDEYLRNLKVIESEEYFDQANHASYNTYRRVAADPASASCELALFAERHAWAGQMCGQGTGGSSSSVDKLLDYDSPIVPKVEMNTVPASHAGCGGRADAYDLAGLRAEDAGGARCVWNNDVLAKDMRKAGIVVEGHRQDSPAEDFCLYERQPIYVYHGHSELVVLKSSGSTQGNVMDDLHGEETAFRKSRLLSMTDGAPIPPERFSATAVRRFVSQPVKTALGER